MRFGTPENRRLYIHIRKCGGTSVEQVLARHFALPGFPFHRAGQAFPIRGRLERLLCKLGLPVPAAVRAAMLSHYQHWPTFWLERFGLLRGVDAIVFNLRDPLQITPSSLKYVSGQLPPQGVRRIALEAFLQLHAGADLQAFRAMPPPDAMRLWMDFQDFCAHYSLRARSASFGAAVSAPRDFGRLPALQLSHRHGIPNVLGGMVGGKRPLREHYEAWKGEADPRPRLGISSLWLLETLYRRPWELLELDGEGLRGHFAQPLPWLEQMQDIYPHRTLRLERLAEDLRGVLLQAGLPPKRVAAGLRDLGHALASEGPAAGDFHSQEYVDWTLTTEWFYYLHFPHYLQMVPEEYRAGADLSRLPAQVRPDWGPDKKPAG